MLYQQSVDNIKLIILTLDGGLLDLNRLRYNYLRHTCKSYDQSISKQVFSNYLGNMNTMYECSPIKDQMSNNDLNKNIEKDLFEYAKLKQNIKKDGVDELLQFAHQKKIKVAVVSTHKSKRAIQYLQLTGIYNSVDFVIGGDSSLKPLPDQAIIQTILEQMNVPAKNALVVANFNSMVVAANKVMTNVLFMPDLVEQPENIDARVFRVVRNNLEVINTFLFSKYDSLEIYSPMLGMSRNMSRAVLTNTYHHLIDKYQDDAQLIDLVNQTYHYFLNQLDLEQDNVMEVIDLPIMDESEDVEEIIEETIQPFTFDDEEIDEKVIQTAEEPDIEEQFIEEKNDIKTITDEVTTNNEEVSSNASEPTSAIALEASRMNELMDIINGNEVIEDDNVDLANDNVNETEKSQEALEENEKGLLNHLISFIYTLLVSFIVTLLGLLINVGAKDFLNRDGVINNVINEIINFYLVVVESFYKFIFDGINGFISAFPSYNHIIAGNGIFSSLAMKVILFVVFNVLIVYICKGIYYIITGEEDVE